MVWKLQELSAFTKLLLPLLRGGLGCRWNHKEQGFFKPEANSLLAGGRRRKQSSQNAEIVPLIMRVL